MSRVPTKIGKYPVEEKIAEGGMGAVFKGTHPTLEQPVVLKKLTLNNSEHLTERFRREAKIMIEFSHENIVRVYDHFKQASSYYIVQEFVDGCSVDILLKKERYLDINTGLYIFYHACKALQYAHNRQVIHRDIKPANIMVSRTGEIKLVDFGIAQADSEEDALTRDGMTLGTPSYMAPEQFEDSRNVTCQADIYSLGVMLYEMLTGKKPFPGKINPETILKIQKGRYASPRKLQPEIPGFAAALIKNCMQAQLKKRASSIAVLMKKLDRWYQSAPVEDIRQNIVALLNDEPVEKKAGPLNSRRNQKKILGFSLLALLLLGAGLFGYWKGYHYRYLMPGQYGGFRILLEIPKPLKSAEELYVSSSLFQDDNKSIPEVEGSITYRVVEASGVAIVFQTNPVYMEPGTYRIKTVIDDQVIWTNLYLEPMKTEGPFFRFGSLSSVNLSSLPDKPLPLTVSMRAAERKTGRDLSDIAVTSVLWDNDYIPLAELEEELMTDNVYKFRISAPGYHANDYHLRIRPYQTFLQLDAQLVPREGALMIEGLQKGVRLKIDNKTMILSGGFPGEMIDLSEWDDTKGDLMLSPAEYIVSFDYKGTLQEVPVTIEAGETFLLKLRIDEKEKTLDILKE